MDNILKTLHTTAGIWTEFRGRAAGVLADG